MYYLCDGKTFSIICKGTLDHVTSVKFGNIHYKSNPFRYFICTESYLQAIVGEESRSIAALKRGAF